MWVHLCHGRHHPSDTPSVEQALTGDEVRDDEVEELDNENVEELDRLGQKADKDAEGGEG